MIDILQKIIDEEITEDQAYEIFQTILEKFHNNELDVEPKEILKMNNYEWTAFGHGADLKTLAKWRQQGWPKHCSQCNTLIDYKEYGWIIRNNKLIGLNCCN